MMSRRRKAMQQWVIVVGIGLLLLPLLGCQPALPASAQAQSDAVDLHRQVQLLNLINGLELTPEQMHFVLEKAQEAQEIREGLKTEADTEELTAVLEEMRETLIQGENLSQDLKERYWALHGDNKRLLATYEEDINSIALEVEGIPEPHQVYALEQYVPRIIPPEGELRIGQAQDTSGGEAALGRLRAIPDDRFERHKQGNERNASQEIFVDINNPNCDDTNPGTEDQPLCSIQEAAERSTPGTPVYVKEGIYREKVTVTTSGTAGALIKFVTEEGDHVVIDSPGEACFDLREVEYIKIHGFELTGAWLAQGGSAAAWHTEEITPAHGGGIRAFPLDEEGFGVRNSIFTYNVIHDNDAGIWLVYSDHNLINSNVIYNSGEASIRIKRGDHNHIYNNLVFSNGSNERWGITFYCAIGTRVYHNTIVEPSGGAVYIYEGTSNLNGALPGSAEYCIPSNNTQIYDNIGVVRGIEAGDSAPLVIGSSTTTDRDPILDTLYGPLSNTYHYNLWYNRSAADAIVSWGDLAERHTFEHYALLSLEEFQQKQEGYGLHSMATDPLFVDPAHWDFRLADDSPAKGAASDGTDLGVDFGSLPRFSRPTVYLPLILNNTGP
ncbi:MAG: hypothetical protein DRI80_04225 [Chloroflexota bacterium]|nr:MAG: hypothetical protein DRI80_04225 [Chloroflexota bacterium]